MTIISLKMNVTLVHVPAEGAYYGFIIVHVTCVISRIKKGIPGLTHIAVYIIWRSQ